MKLNSLFTFTTALLFYTTFAAAQIKGPVKVTSPGKTTVLEIGSGGQPLSYRVLFRGKEVVSPSPLGFTLNDMPVSDPVIITAKSDSKFSDTFSWPIGENDRIENKYNETLLDCKSGAIDFKVRVRAYDNSVAFRYEFAQTGNTTLNRELTGFNFNASYTLYQYHHESVFTPVSIDSLTTTCDFPATLTNGTLYLSIGEAENDSYTKAELGKGKVPHSLAVVFAREAAVKFSGAFKTPWRTVSIAESAIGLHQFSELNLKLNPPAKDGVPAWIKPGKLIRAQLTTQSGIECIDFAVKHNFKYILFDAGWYGAEFRGSSDPTVVIPEIDLPKVIAYGKEKGIGVILYVNYVGLKAKLDTILPLYKKWGVAGFKFGFVDGFTQQGITWLAAAVKKVYDYGFLLNVHDNYKPTGLSRTYPSFLTQEGIRGDENSPDAFHTTTLPFTRFLAGPGDFTYCFPNPANSFSKNLKVSKGHQLALTVVYFSPLQAMFWYGKPNDYTNDDEIEFFNYVPTVWNESHYLAGEIGKNISVARRSGTTWFVGNAAGDAAWKSSIKLDFLTKGKRYKATVFEDDGKGGVRKRSQEVTKGQTFGIDLQAKSGQSMMIELI